MKPSSHPRKPVLTRRPLTSGERAGLYWLAIAGSSLFIGVLWALLLPSQLAEIRLDADAGDSPWRVAQDEMKAASFQDTLDKLRRQMEDHGANVPAPDDAAAAAYSGIPEKLQTVGEKLVEENINAKPQ